MREYTVQEKDVKCSWREGKGQLVSVRLKNIKMIEAWMNKQITRENIHEIGTIKIIKNFVTLDLSVDTKKTGYYYSQELKVKEPVFYITTSINRKEFNQLLDVNKGNKRKK